MFLFFFFCVKVWKKILLYILESITSVCKVTKWTKTFVSCGCMCVCSHTIWVCTLLTEHPSKCEEGENQEREHDRQHLQLSSKCRCHVHPLPQLCVNSECLICQIRLPSHQTLNQYSIKKGLNTYPERVTGAFRRWPWHSSFMTHDTHTNTYKPSISLSLSVPHLQDLWRAN